MPRQRFRIRTLVAILATLVACSSGRQLFREESAVDLRGKLAEEAYLGPYWEQRASYPTGHFNPRWLHEAAQDAARIGKALPAGIEARRSATALDPQVFTPLGPRPLGSGGGIAGRVNVVVSHPTNPAIAWLGADGGGVWKTSNCCDSNTTWTNTTDISADAEPIQNSAIGDLTLDPNDPDVLYAGTGDLRYGSFSFGSNGILKSVDGGESWTVKGADVFNPFYPPNVNLPPQYQAIGKVVVDPNHSNIVIVGAKTGIYLSYNGGDDWTGPCLTNAFPTQRQDITGLIATDLGATTRLIAAVGTRAFATTVQTGLEQNGANGLYRATVPASGCPAFTTISRPDNGWPAGTAQGVPVPGNPLGRIDIAGSPSDPNVIYAQVAVPNSGSTILGVWRSGDGGDHWTQTQIGTISGSGTQSWYNAGMTVHPSDPNTLILSAFRTFKSTSGGSAFVSMGSTPHVDHHARAFVGNDPNRLLIGTDGGVYYSGNAMAATPTWTALNATLNTIEFYSGGISPNFNTSPQASAVGGAQDNSCMVSTWSGGSFGAQTWFGRNGGDGFWSTIEPILQQRWYYSSQNGAIVATSTASGGLGSTGTQAAAPSGWGGDRKSFLTNFDLYRFGGETTGCPAATGCGRIIAGSYRVWESTSGGVPTSSWVANSPDLTKGTLGDRSFINQVAYAVSTPENAIAGTNDGNVWIGFNLGQNLANSATWVDVTGGNAVLPNRFVLDVATDPLDPLIGYAVMAGFDQNTPTTPGHVFQVKCTAACASFTWRDVSGNLPNIPVNSVIVNPHRPTQVFAGSDWGLYYTDDVEANPVVWQKHAGLPNVMIWDMSIDRGFTTLAVWTRARGAWVWPLPGDADSLFQNGFE
ncbi:MAG: hypothetical protein IT479_03375 [Xanthomonadales bacterium]|nr:hypothetical protein [Xanthomonadales bacterium]MCC6592291.1 hypothetical protein [Xanthomonadales bacterium]MCE7931636.1 hypothetical protein [Xanthomonadales bacterium PRO6]